MLVATYVAFGLAVLVGVYLIATAGWQLLLVGAASILAGVLYTGGPRPYGYEGLGEVFVFLFFGVVAVTGLVLRAGRAARAGRRSCSPCRSGCSPSAILMVNNMRDLETDRRAGKRTLAVRLGRDAGARAVRRDGLRARSSPRRCPGCSAARASSPWLLLPWLALPLAAPIVRDRARRAPTARR